MKSTHWGISKIAAYAILFIITLFMAASASLAEDWELDNYYSPSMLKDKYNVPVGIGKWPSATLDVNGTIRAVNICDENGSNCKDISLGWTSGDGYSLDAADGSPTDVVYVNASGYVGIGTTSPGEKLEVEGDMDLSNDLHLSSSGYINFYGDKSYQHSIASRNSSGTADDDIRINSYGAMYINLDSNNNNSSSADFKIGRHGGSGAISNWFFTLNGENGYVGIGTANPQTLLSVNGIITTKEVQVTDSGWSDFVFEDNYPLPSLDKVESFIKENKHLPDVPSARQVEEEGLSMAEMMKKQMQKIEELTLYVIELQKQVDKLKTEKQIL